MSMTREQIEALLVDVTAEHLERLRAELFEKLLALRAPEFALTPRGELYCDGKLVGDVRPVLRKVLSEVLAERDARLTQ
jgi:hypothetical protein